MADPIRVELDGALAGHEILVDPEELTFGVVEDMEVGRAATILDALSRCIVGGSLPKGHDRASLRRHKPAEIEALLKGVGTAFAVPKS